jgi:hypothetical protein
VSIEIFLVPWFICIFTKNFNNEMIEVIWDNLFLDRKLGFIKVALSFIDIFKDDLTRCESLEEL